MYIYIMYIYIYIHIDIYIYIYLKVFAPCRRPPSLRLLGTCENMYSNIAPRGFGTRILSAFEALNIHSD